MSWPFRYMYRSDWNILYYFRDLFSQQQFFLDWIVLSFYQYFVHWWNIFSIWLRNCKYDGKNTKSWPEAATKFLTLRALKIHKFFSYTIYLFSKMYTSWLLIAWQTEIFLLRFCLTTLFARVSANDRPLLVFSRRFLEFDL